MFELSKICGANLKLGARSCNFVSDDTGNVGTIFALLLLPLLVVIGAATDYTKMSGEVSSAQDAADAAVLHAAHEYYKNFSRSSATSIGDLASSYHLDSDGALGEYLVETVVADSDAFSLTLKTTVSGTTQHAFMGLVGNSETPWTATSYSVVSIPQIEIALVMDVSASMKGEKLTQLKAALNNFIDNVAPYRRGETHIAISLLPYAETINFGQEADVWLHPSNSDPFNGCFITTETDIPGSMTPGAIGGNGGAFNLPLCPPETSEAVLFSTDGDALKAHIDGLELGFGTHSERGLLWAERLFINSWRNSARPFSANNPILLKRKTHKVVVLLTDGRLAITDPDQDGHTSPVAESDTSITNANFAAQCRAFENYNNLDLYTVAYDINNTELENLLKDCVVGNGGFYEAEVDDLDAVFERVSEGLNPIRISN